MKTAGWAAASAGVVLLVGGAVWAFSPTDGEMIIRHAAHECGVDEGFYSFESEQRDRAGKIIAVEYSTDGHSQDFGCITRQLRSKGISPKIGQEIDA